MYPNDIGPIVGQLTADDMHECFLKRSVDAGNLVTNCSSGEEA